MASMRSRHQVGSTQWAQDEREVMKQATAAELEDFCYSARNEFDWLNEKMIEVFSNDARTLTDVFKTPGKLRGKTPRSTRKVNAFTPRAPLTDIFAPNSQSISKLASPKVDLVKMPRFDVTQDENQPPSTKHSSRSKSPQRAGKPGNIDSGYHGLTEDEMESQREMEHNGDDQASLKQRQTQDSGRGEAEESEHSFSSARENMESKLLLAQKAAQQLEEEMAAQQSVQTTSDANADPVAAAEQHHTTQIPLNEDEDMEDVSVDHTAESEHMLHRKSSFNFSSLPAREPLLSKRSLETRISQYDPANRASILSKPAAKQSLARPTGSGHAEDAPSNESQVKTTTQRLHERITLLGKNRDTVHLKDPATIRYPELPTAQSNAVAEPTVKAAAEPEEWIKPSISKASFEPQRQEVAAMNDARPQTAASIMTVDSVPASTSAVQPSKSAASSSTRLAPGGTSTPVASPNSKRTYEGPLSSSKNKLMSVFKLGRSLFASSASTSAAAKLEAHTTTPSRPSPARDFSNESSFSVNMPGALHSEATLMKSPSRPLSVISLTPSRKTRNSNESERKKEKAQQKADEELEKAREKERIKVQEEQRRAEDAARAAAEKETQAASRSAMPLVGKLKSVGRPVRPVKDAPKEKPAPINVKVTSQMQQQEPQVMPPRAASVRPSSSHSTFKSSTAAVPNSRVRALEAAQRKKELEEKAKQRKAEQKKELERKRAAKIEEEERKAAEAERKAEEQRRVQEAKLAAQRQAEKQAAEAKRREQQRLEALRQQEESEKARAEQELAETIARDRAQQQAQSRSDLTGTLRQLAAKTFGESSRPVVAMNPAKPPKRHVDETEEPAQRPAVEKAAYQQNDSKRRKTDEKEEIKPRASVMAPPKRPSTIRKETVTRLPYGYSQAPPTVPPTSMFKSITNQYQKPLPAHPSQTVQMSNARIAFADNSGPQVAMPSGHPDAGPKYKTPVRPVQQQAKSAAKSSPMYPNGDSIALPEIATDSEDEDDDDEDTGFRAPSWVASPALRELIAQQQLVDPETVFGPIGELRMEEVFKGVKNPERLKKFRDRGSSAAWVQNGDAVTSAEKRRDMEMRERVAREGGWRYQPGL